MMWMSKPKANAREQILFGRDFDAEIYRRMGGAIRFSATLETVEKLVSAGFLKLKERQNNSPTTGEMIAFAKAHPNTEWYFGGYSISPEREDVCVFIDEISARHCDPEDAATVSDFATAFSKADELTLLDCHSGDTFPLIDHDAYAPALRAWFD